jgi:hypothetical protein
MMGYSEAAAQASNARALLMIDAFNECQPKIPETPTAFSVYSVFSRSLQMALSQETPICYGCSGLYQSQKRYSSSGEGCYADTSRSL